MQFISGISQIIDDYDFFILDIWGVLHDGRSLYPNAIETLKFLKEKQKKVCLLSNAPRRAFIVKEFLDKMLITNQYYDFIITSGETAHNYLDFNVKENYQYFGKKYFYIGPKKDIDLIKTLNYSLVELASDADFVLTTGFENESSTIEEKIEQILSAKQDNLPMICVNPDMIVVRIDGSKMQCAGVIAKEYERIGGKVIYFGKPFAKVYELAIDFFEKNFAQEIDRKKIIAIGDGIETDIKGAKNFNIDSILVLGGILSNQLEINFSQKFDNKFIDDASKSKLNSICNNEKIFPKFVISTLNI